MPFDDGVDRNDREGVAPLTHERGRRTAGVDVTEDAPLGHFASSGSVVEYAAAIRGQGRPLENSGVAVKAFIRRALVSAASVAVVGTLAVGCSSDTEPLKPEKSSASTSVAEPSADEPVEPSPSASAAPAIKVGESGTFDFYETDEYGQNPKAVTQLEVAVKSAEYVTPTQINTTNEPEKGQFLKLTITVKNVGKAPGEFAAYGMMTWEDAGTAAQEATTLEGVGEGQDVDTTYKPGQAVTGSLILDVGAKGGALSYANSIVDEAPAFTIELPKA
ncbi:DUF4352 domain-containing protein [Streptomyces sp. NPDC058542]|uniref:DUF4352 domain-containing protein n=1 Tax=Streptomyces sp. NPDC058542 TaxID=3346543 RepID=UPI003660FB89